MPRKRRAEKEHPDDIGVETLALVTEEQRQQLVVVGYRSAWPSTAWQASGILGRYSALSAVTMASDAAL